MNLGALKGSCHLQLWTRIGTVLADRKIGAEKENIVSAPIFLSALRFMGTFLFLSDLPTSHEPTSECLSTEFWRTQRRPPLCPLKLCAEYLRFIVSPHFQQSDAHRSHEPAIGRSADRLVRALPWFDSRGQSCPRSAGRLLGSGKGAYDFDRRSKIDLRPLAEGCGATESKLASVRRRP